MAPPTVAARILVPESSWPWYFSTPISISAPATPPTIGLVPVHAFSEQATLDDWLVRGLGQLKLRLRAVSVGVICRSPITARRVGARMQSRGLPARVVFDGRFLPRGVQISTVEEVKGLEFDLVVLPRSSRLPELDDVKAALAELVPAVVRRLTRSGKKP